MKSMLPVHFEVNNSTAIFYYVLDERMKLDSADAIANGTVGAHAANGVDVVIYGNDQATSAFEWSTLSGAEGALTDATKTALVDQGSGKTIFDAGSIVKVSIGKSGTGPSVDCNLCLHFSQARSY